MAKKNKKERQLWSFYADRLGQESHGGEGREMSGLTLSSLALLAFQDCAVQGATPLEMTHHLLGLSSEGKVCTQDRLAARHWYACVSPCMCLKMCACKGVRLALLTQAGGGICTCGGSCGQQVFVLCAVSVRRCGNQCVSLSA